MYPAITPQRKKGDEPLLAPDGKTVAQLMDFWQWAYTKSAAPVVLWPCGDAAYENMHKRPYSAHLQNLNTTKEIIVAGSRVVRLPLPYVYGTSGYETILK